MMINIHSMRLSVDTNGPGRRIVIWTQGCTLNCPGCFNIVQQPHEPMNLVDVEQLTGFLVGKLVEYGCEGITISGGEPFQQAKAVLKLCNNIQKSGYSIVIFSGYRKEELLKQSSVIVDELFKLPDILLLGRYQTKNRHINRTWLVNPDKDFVTNTSRYKIIDFDKPAYIEFRMKDVEILITGFPTASDLNNLRKDFWGKGIVLDVVDSMFET